MDVKIVDMFVTGHRAGRAETGVGKRLAGGFHGRLDRNGPARIVDPGDDLLGGGGFFGKVGVAGHKHIQRIDLPRLAESAQAVVNRHLFKRRFEERQVGVGMSKHLGARQA